MVLFRPSTIGDLDGLLKLQQQLLCRGWISLCRANRAGRLATVAQRFEPRARVVDEIFVAPTHRHRGLGRAALDTLEAACEALALRALHLVVERRKETAIKLYEAHGFVSHDRCLMSKRFDVVPDVGSGEQPGT